MFLRDAVGTQLLARALRLVLYLRDRGEPVRLAELLAVTGTSKSNVYRLLHTLEMSGLVMRSERGYVTLGLRFLDLGRALEQRLEREVFPSAFPVMRRLTLALGETSMLTMVAGMSAICVVSVESPHPFRLSYATGRVMPLYAGASGKVLLPWMPWRLRDRVLRECENVTLPNGARRSAPQLRSEIAAIRSRGYCVTEGEVDPGAIAVAVPVLRSDGNLLAGLTVAGPSVRLRQAQLTNVIDRVRAAAGEISIDSDRMVDR